MVKSFEKRLGVREANEPKKRSWFNKYVVAPAAGLAVFAASTVPSFAGSAIYWKVDIPFDTTGMVKKHTIQKQSNLLKGLTAGLYLASISDDNQIGVDDWYMNRVTKDLNDIVQKHKVNPEIPLGRVKFGEKLTLDEYGLINIATDKNLPMKTRAEAWIAAGLVVGGAGYAIANKSSSTSTPHQSNQPGAEADPGLGGIDGGSGF